MSYEPNDSYNNQSPNGFPNGEYRYTSPSIRQDAASGRAQYAPSSEVHFPDANQPKTDRRRRRRFAALLMAGCLVFSVIGGFGGAVLASRLGLTSNGNTVLYQSVEPGEAAEISTVGYSAVVQKVEDTVVAITTESVATNFFFQQYITQGAGSGVILTEDGYIVTNHHVINGARQITVTLNDGTDYPAMLVGSDAENDTAIIKVNASGLTPAVMGNSDTLAVGEAVLAIGNPLGTLSGTVTDGIISALQREVTIDGTAMTLMQTSAAVNPGNSGGGLFNTRGELIGIVNAKSSSDSSGNAVDNIGFAIPVNSVKDIIEDLITEGYVTGRIVLGINAIEIPDERTAMRYGLTRPGLYVQSVESGSIAALGGLRPGDCILTFGDAAITVMDDLTTALAECSVGDRVEVTVDRNGREHALQLVMTEYVPAGITTQ